MDRLIFSFFISYRFILHLPSTSMFLHSVLYLSFSLPTSSYDFHILLTFFQFQILIFFFILYSFLSSRMSLYKMVFLWLSFSLQLRGMTFIEYIAYFFAISNIDYHSIYIYISSRMFLYKIFFFYDFNRNRAIFLFTFYIYFLSFPIVLHLFSHSPIVVSFSLYLPLFLLFYIIWIN